MLPEVQEAQETVEGLGHYPLGSVMVVAGFMLLFFVEHILFNVEQKIFGSPASMSPPSQNPIKAVNDLARETKRGPKTLRDIVEPIRGPVILLLAISVHSLFEALALGLEVGLVYLHTAHSLAVVYWTVTGIEFMGALYSLYVP